MSIATGRNDCRAWVPVPPGGAYRIESPPDWARVTPDLAAELLRVLERFAREAGFTPERKVSVFFKPGIFGHHQVGRAADIYGINGVGIDEWKRRWDRACACGSVKVERRRNLGWRLYKALQKYGRWSQPYGYPIQLFGPWTRREGPWRHISDFLLKAHADHIHVAK
jgi:hypothetical protein